MSPATIRRPRARARAPDRRSTTPLRRSSHGGTIGDLKPNYLAWFASSRTRGRHVRRGEIAPSLRARLSGISDELLRPRQAMRRLDSLLEHPPGANEHATRSVSDEQMAF